LAKANWLSNNLCHPLAEASGNLSSGNLSSGNLSSGNLSSSNLSSGNLSSGNLSSGNLSMVKLWFVSTIDSRSKFENGTYFLTTPKQIKY
jgi:uncharacterized protein YjbI with pentapeptide repeats